MLIGLFGGAFDPIHYGHLRSVEEVREAMALDEVWFIPTATPPHKDAKYIAPFNHRLEMTRLAVKDIGYFKVLDIEARRQGPSYSVDTLMDIKTRYPDTEFYFILGSDAFVLIDLWKDYSRIIEFASIVVMSRAECESDDEWGAVKDTIARAFPSVPVFEQFVLQTGHAIYLKHVTHLDISSTRIRELISCGQSIRFLVPDEVVKYLERHDLYRDQAEQKAMELAMEVLDNKGEEVVILDLRGLSDFTSYFVIAHGRSTRHVQGIVDNVREALEQRGEYPLSVEGEKDARWVLMDYGEVVIHLFYEPMRAFYDLEGLWGQAKKKIVSAKRRTQGHVCSS
ncbi:MAG: nicotinate-nucleotide adenylyltransferase [Dissulfurimicrobium sp.]|uniref:nicotinate-nucleotide adenylyltransferase n=1 Tax=Dissulfurimicrobium sp. TaxID=2022436 RepID=UPI00404A5DEB